jgi:hypothetical protein
MAQKEIWVDERLSRTAPNPKLPQFAQFSTSPAD